MCCTSSWREEGARLSRCSRRERPSLAETQPFRSLRREPSAADYNTHPASSIYTCCSKPYGSSISDSLSLRPCSFFYIDPADIQQCSCAVDVHRANCNIKFPARVIGARECWRSINRTGRIYNGPGPIYLGRLYAQPHVYTAIYMYDVLALFCVLCSSCNTVHCVQYTHCDHDIQHIHML